MGRYKVFQVYEISGGGFCCRFFYCNYLARQENNYTNGHRNDDGFLAAPDGYSPFSMHVYIILYNILLLY